MCFSVRGGGSQVSVGPCGGVGSRGGSFEAGAVCSGGEEDATGQWGYCDECRQLPPFPPRRPHSPRPF